MMNSADFWSQKWKMSQVKGMMDFLERSTATKQPPLHFSNMWCSSQFLHHLDCQIWIEKFICSHVVFWGVFTQKSCVFFSTANIISTTVHLLHFSSKIAFFPGNLFSPSCRLDITGCVGVEVEPNESSLECPREGYEIYRNEELLGFPSNSWK